MSTVVDIFYNGTLFKESILPQLFSLIQTWIVESIPLA